jgi:hypothetical protein
VSETDVTADTTPDSVAPTAAAQLATALEWLDHPRGFKLDALDSAIRALALANAEREADLASVKGVLYAIDKRLHELSAMIQELHAWRERSFDGDGR